MTQGDHGLIHPYPRIWYRPNTYTLKSFLSPLRSHDVLTNPKVKGDSEKSPIQTLQFVGLISWNGLTIRDFPGTPLMI